MTRRPCRSEFFSRTEDPAIMKYFAGLNAQVICYLNICNEYFTFHFRRLVIEYTMENGWISEEDERGREEVRIYNIYCFM